MKDKKLGEKFDALEFELKSRVGILESEIEAKPPWEIRFCKKCGHETMQKRGELYAFFKEKDFDYMCLNCGTKWDCSTQTICTEIVPKSKGKGGEILTRKKI